MPQVADADLKAANASLQKSLTDQALADLQSQKPANYLFLASGIQSSYTSSVAPSASGKATVTGKLSLQGLVFDQETVKNTIADSLGMRYNFDSLDPLAVTPIASTTGSSTPSSYTSSQNIPVNLSGTLTSGNAFDAEALKRVLAGKSKAQLPELLKSFPEITSANASIHPFWSSTFPEKPEKIKVNVTK